MKMVPQHMRAAAQLPAAPERHNSPPQLSVGWTDERVQQLKQLWSQGYSCSQIAHKIGGRLTRNAVIGKVSRLGLPPRMKQKRYSGPPRKRAKALPVLQRRATHAASAFDEQPLPPVAATDVARIQSVLDLQDYHCRWIVGDPKVAGWGYCGDQKAPGVSYCAGHAARAFVTQPAAKPQRADHSWKDGWGKRRVA